MSYTATSLLLVVEPEEARNISAGGDFNDAFNNGTALFVSDSDGALLCALRALAQSYAPGDLSLFARHWTTEAEGRAHLVEGRHADLLAGVELAGALAATQFLMRECAERPDRIATLLETVLPQGEDADSLEEALREAAALPVAATLQESAGAVAAEIQYQYLPMSALHAWLRAFELRLIHAKSTDQVVVHLAIQ